VPVHTSKPFGLSNIFFDGVVPLDRQQDRWKIARGVVLRHRNSGALVDHLTSCIRKRPIRIPFVTHCYFDRHCLLHFAIATLSRMGSQ
jgi:hypothetical protein